MRSVEVSDAVRPPAKTTRSPMPAVAGSCTARASGPEACSTSVVGGALVAAVFGPPFAGSSLSAAVAWRTRRSAVAIAVSASTSAKNRTGGRATALACPTTRWTGDLNRDHGANSPCGVRKRISLQTGQIRTADEFTYPTGFEPHALREPNRDFDDVRPY